MFSDIIIERFRGIRYANIPELSRVNVFFGKNNCGKSSLLEAIFLVCGQSNPQLPININILRGYRTLHNINDLSIDFYNLDTTSSIHISAGGEEPRDLEINSLFFTILIHRNEQRKRKSITIIGNTLPTNTRNSLYLSYVI